jgi:hypothetical protein
MSSVLSAEQDGWTITGRRKPLSRLPTRDHLPRFLVARPNVSFALGHHAGMPSMVRYLQVSPGILPCAHGDAVTPAASTSGGRMRSAFPPWIVEIPVKASYIDSVEAVEKILFDGNIHYVGS